MTLFHDVTADYTERPRHVGDAASPLRMSREELQRLYESGLAIADTETTGLKAGENGLTEPAVIRAMTIGEIKTYNNEAQRQGLAKDQRIPVPRGYADREIRLIALQQFVLPNRPMIHDREDGHAMPRGSYNSDQQKAFEYDISAYALGVTGAEVMREKGYGPLTDLKIHNEQVKALPSFLPLMESFLLFTGTSNVGPKQGVAYFNSPFDIPFLRELFVDAMAYEAAKKNEHRQHDRAINRRLPIELDVDYGAETTTPEQRAMILSHVRKRLLDSDIAQKKMEEYFTPARWHCVLQAYRTAHPELASHTLDGLMHSTGLAHGDRGAHSAIEDVVLTARGMLNLLAEGKLDQNELPTMGELPGIILSRSHGDGVNSHAAPNGSDVVIDLKYGNGPHAKGVEQWVSSFDRANPADVRQPALNPHGKQWFKQFEEDEKGFHLIASGAEKRPLFLSFTKHLGVASHLLDGRYKWLTALEANDKPGTYVDVTADGICLHDVPWNILRRNVAYIDQQPEAERTKLIAFLRDIEKASNALGGVLLREEDGVRYLRLYGHVRQHGTVDIPWPKKTPIADARTIVFSHLEQATRFGLVPHAARGDLRNSSEGDENTGAVEAEETKRAVVERTYSSTTLDIIAPAKEPHIHREITPAMFQLLKASLPPNERYGNFNRSIDTVKFGKHYAITVSKVVRGNESFITLDGLPEAFDAYVARRKPDGTFEAMADKPTNILTDAGWLLDRLQKIPGVPKDGVEVTVNNRIIVRQPLGIGTDTLALMQAVGMPYRAAEKELRFSAGALMQDAFTYSLGISRALKSKNYEKNMGANSIVPSLTKGLKDNSEKGESHKRLDHVKFDPLLGLQLHYRARTGEMAEIIRIPPDKMLARSLPIGRRRVQRVFARLAHSPKKIESVDKEMRWEVTLTKLEQVLLANTLLEVGAHVAWRQNEKGEACFVIAESALSARDNPVYLAMQTMSDQLSQLVQATDVPEWYFSAQPELHGDRITLQLPERSALFSSSAVPVYKSIQDFLTRMQKGGINGKSLSKVLLPIMDESTDKGGSVLKRLDYALRRNPDAQLSILLNVIEQESPNLLALHCHTRALAGCITPSDKMNDKDKRALALNQELMDDRIVVAHIIAACDALADKEAGQSEEWVQLRHLATDVADRMARTIHGVDRLREALTTGAHTIANDGAHWRSSLIGASVHARLDVLEKIYLEAAECNAPDLVVNYISKQRATLEQFSMQQRGDKIEQLLKPYLEHGALRLAVLYALESKPALKQQFAQAAIHALRDVYGFDAAQSHQLLAVYETAANPAAGMAQCCAAGEAFLQHITLTHPDFTQQCYLLPMQLFGKVSATDIVAMQRQELAPHIAKEVKKAYHQVGLAHLYIAAEMQAELEKLRFGKQQTSIREISLKTGVQRHTSEMLHCYKAAGYSTENAEAMLRNKTRAAVNGSPQFNKELAKHKEFFAEKDKCFALVEYGPKQQLEILSAAITQAGGQQRFEELLEQQLPNKTSYASELQAICINAPTFEACRAQVNKAAILTAKNRMMAELDDLSKIQYHTRRDLEALGLLLQHMAVQLQPHLEATPIKPQRMDLPEFQGLTKNPIPELCAGAQALDRKALQQAKARFNPSMQVTKDEYTHRRIYHSLSALLQKPTENILDIQSLAAPQKADSARNEASDHFLLDTSAVIGYFETLRHPVARPGSVNEKNPDHAGYHRDLLQRLEMLAQPPAHGAMPLGIPDYVIYELSGIMPPMIEQASKRFEAIAASYGPKLEKAQGARYKTLLQTKAREYQVEIDNLVDWSIRLDRRRPLDQKSSIGDRVEELNQLFTLVAYHPEVIKPTGLGRQFYQSARVESAVVAGVGMINHPATAAYYRNEMTKLAEDIAKDQPVQTAPALAHYTLSFNDLLQTPSLDFDIRNLRIHWGQMYFIGLIGEDQYRDFMRNMSGAEAANEQGYDSNKRFVTYGSLINRTKDTGLTGSGLVKAVKNASAMIEYEGSKPETVNRRNLTFDELERFVPEPELDVRHAIGPAKLTMDQCIFGGLLPGASIKRHREGDAHTIRENDAEVETLRLMARTLGYTPQAISPSGKDRYESLRNSLKHQGFFERQVTIEDCVRLQQAFTHTGTNCAALDRLLEHIPTMLAEKPKGLVKNNRADGSVQLSAPLERLFSQALVHGVVSPAQFTALVAKLEPAALNINHAPACSIKSDGLLLQFRLRKSVPNIRGLTTADFASVIDPDSLWLTITDNSAPHFNRCQNFCDLVAVGRSARRSGTNFSEGQALLDRMLANKFCSSETAPQQRLVTAHAAFTELFGAADGDAVFFQLMKDFESRQERQFQSGDHISSPHKPAECVIAANHRNRLIDRRNKGEVSVVETARTMGRTMPSAKLWVIGNDSDIVSAEQFRWLDPETKTPKNGRGKPQDPVTLGKKCESPGVRLRPPVAAQHSRLVAAQGNATDDDANIHNVPTRDWLEYVGRLNGVVPTAHLKPDDFTHKYAKASVPFRSKFSG